MATTYTTRLNLGKPAPHDRDWGTTANATLDVVEALNPVAALNVATAEVPSASLNVKIAPGACQRADGSIAVYPGATAQAVPPGATTVLYLDGGGALVLAASYPAGPHTRLATVLAGPSSIQTVVDDRIAATALLAFLPLSGGSLADGSSLALGTTTGTRIGTAAAQKLGFLGAAPVPQQTFGAATAGTTWTAAEQGMLQKVYDALRAFGFGS